MREHPTRDPLDDVLKIRNIKDNMYLSSPLAILNYQRLHEPHADRHRKPRTRMWTASISAAGKKKAWEKAGWSPVRRVEKWLEHGWYGCCGGYVYDILIYCIYDIVCMCIYIYIIYIDIQHHHLDFSRLTLTSIACTERTWTNFDSAAHEFSVERDCRCQLALSQSWSPHGRWKRTSKLDSTLIPSPYY